MIALSPSELVLLYADQFIRPRVSPIANAYLTHGSRRRVNRRLLVIETVRAAILASQTLEVLHLELRPPQDLRDNLDRLEAIGSSGKLVSRLIAAIGVDVNKPRTHVSRSAQPNPWQASMLEATLLGRLGDAPLSVTDLISEAFGTHSPDDEAVSTMQTALEKRGVLEKRKRLFGTAWTLSPAGQVALAQVNLEPVKTIYANHKRHFPNVWAQLEEDISLGFSKSDS